MRTYPQVGTPFVVCRPFTLVESLFSSVTLLAGGCSTTMAPLSSRLLPTELHPEEDVGEAASRVMREQAARSGRAWQQVATPHLCVA
jgi:hypothetical protein